MTPKEFVMWFKGFSEACHHLNPTPQQWEKIIEKLKEVKDESKSCTCSGTTITYPYSGYTGTTYINNASKPDSNQLPNGNQLLNG